MSVRARYRGTKVTVNTTAIQSLFLPGGGVADHGKQTGRKIRAAAEADAAKFVRSGDLLLSHTGPFYSPTWLGGHVTIGNTSDHARFVHEGTQGPILPRNHTGYLWIRPFPHSRFAFDPSWAEFGGRTPLPRVRGQRANPWMARAMDRVIRSTYI